MAIFIGAPSNPFHLSVGLICLREDKILLIRKTNGNVLLPSESVEDNETIMQCILRCGREELGYTLKIERFLGSGKFNFLRADTEIEKTTLYFLVRTYESIAKAPMPDELDDELFYEEPTTAIKLLEKQRYGQAEFVKRALG